MWQLIRNSVGTNMFRSFYVTTPERGQFDALDDGDNACAFYVSGVLVLFAKLSSVHGTIAGTLADLEQSGWEKLAYVTATIQPGDILVWEPIEYDGKLQEHIGFAIGENRAISNSSTQKAPDEHDMFFGEVERKISTVYRMDNWNNH